MSRYRDREIGVIDNEKYRDYLDRRGLRIARVYRTPKFVYPNPEATRGRLNYEVHTWKAGDRYWALAEKYYRSSRFWHLIALFNQKPSEALIEPGTSIYIPLPLETALELFRGG